MPREGVFARVVEGGDLAEGDVLTVEPRFGGRPYRAAVITLSDQGAAGRREDRSGPAIAARLEASGYEIIERLLLPDGLEPLRGQLIRLCDQRQPDLILTTGGTGFSPRDVTPEATLAVAERQAPGIAEAIRAHSLSITPRARVAGVTLIVKLPGRGQAAEESRDCFLEGRPHGVAVLRGEAVDCGMSRMEG